MTIDKNIEQAYEEYIHWFDNLGINKEYLRETKITSIDLFKQKLIDDYELWYMFGEECTIPLTLMERQEIFCNQYPNMLDIPTHKHYDEHLIPDRKLIK